MKQFMILSKTIHSPQKVPNVRHYYSTQKNKPADTLNEKSFSHISNKKDLINNMKELTSKNIDLPLEFGADANQVIEGTKQLLQDTDLFDFKCTGCGACCKSYPNSVILDSHDIYLMSRSPKLVEMATTQNPNANSLLPGDVKANQQRDRERMSPGLLIKPYTTTYLLREFKDAFRHQLGMIEENAFMPALMLKSKITPNKKEVCHFAFPLEKLTVNDVAKGNNVENKVPESADVYRKKTGLGCGFGPKHMPTACAVYPLGELWSNKEKKIDFFSLDNKNCEGVGILSKAKVPVTKTVRDYQVANNMIFRREQYDWFRKVAASAATTYLDQELMQSKHKREGIASSEIYFMMLQNLWYDFDRVPFTSQFMAKGRDVLEWEEAKQAIEEGTALIVEETRAHAGKLREAELSMRVKVLEEFVQRCLELGLLDETDDI